ncbi:ST8SIA4 [Branchiostoma lanceolatum]|uniref:ST8SIA4 protein n=1 Tax=Branchiostoma lanceolatum TaxID=7740 RepID=A0A8K0F0G7_BRALA|nr:ST8SIA4 [Branchiostoma lanceolatum]
MAPTTDVNKCWSTHGTIGNSRRIAGFVAVALLSAVYILLWVIPFREMLQGSVVPVIMRRVTPTPTTQSAQDWVFENNLATEVKSAAVVPPTLKSGMPPPTAHAQPARDRVFENHLATEVKSAAVVPPILKSGMPPPTAHAQPNRDWVFGNLAPDSSWQFKPEALSEVRNITKGLHLETRLVEHQWGRGNITQKSALPIGHFNACAVVGNSGVLLSSSCGAEIDSMDYVIRIDLPDLRGFEKDVGARTNMTVLNLKTPRRMAKSSHFKNRSQDVYENRLQDVKDSVLLADHRSRQNIMTALEVYKLPFSVLITKNRLRSGVMPIASKVANKPMRKTATIGLVSVLMMTTLCDHAYIYGFFPYMTDMNNVSVPYHYYPHDNVNPPMWDGFDSLHNVDQEYDFHRDLHKRGVLKMHLGPCGKR